MQKIVRAHYPVDQLPEDLRGDMQTGTFVRVVIEIEDKSHSMPIEPDLRTQLEQVRALLPDRVTVEEASERVRRSRSEWDD